MSIPYYWPRFLESWSGEIGPAVGPSAAHSHTDPLRFHTPPADTAAPQSTSETQTDHINKYFKMFTVKYINKRAYMLEKKLY